MLRWLPLLPDHEFAVEANPGTLDEEKIRILAEHGVNRLSLGAQSFHPALLQVLERRHEPSDVARAVEQARRYVPNISLDLIFGVPGQTLDAWQSDLDQALALAPTHLAIYGLTFEKGTRLWKQQRSGLVHALDESAELELYTRAMDVLEAAGFEHYEISNFAQPGFRCRHNQVYWANHAYFGFGQGAARYVEGVRQTTTRDLGDYLKRVRLGLPTHFQSEHLPPRERALETIALQLRRADGIERRRFHEQTGIAFDDLVGDNVARLSALGLLQDDGVSVRLDAAREVSRGWGDCRVVEVRSRAGSKRYVTHSDAYFVRGSSATYHRYCKPKLTPCA